ncbi:Sir2 family NAD-dependent protein deacetylase [Thalassotalea psychrophila]|uniref:protein acetyllysine N-acetyltransferase n=1 Tax=Thalassotalea psychrophila TaxID=3065647 RepID=A0ABY9TXM9_9GAMM|nr:Sir2 family NAD-dependent protein deacetylase [Colwelliaceae bacterium SQ149]
MTNTLYITGAGVSSESGIPTFRGEDGFWTIGSKNYTPMEMATRAMYENNPVEFLSWYYHRFATYRNHGPNEVHHWLSDKNLITQNIDGLDGKAGNKDYIAIHGRLDQMTHYHQQGDDVAYIATPWEDVDESDLVSSLLAIFNIDQQTKRPKLNQSFKPYVLLFDEYYTDLYRITEAQERMMAADKMVFIGTSFSVNITQMALRSGINNRIPIEIVDPDPIELPYEYVTYHKMKASEYIQKA